MEKFNVAQCPVCGTSGFSSYLNCTDFFVSGEEFRIRQCNQCGLKITADIEPEENIGRYYQSEEYISHSNTTKGLLNRVYHGVRSYMLGRKRRLVEKVSALKTGRILDVGTGTGYFLHEMLENGWHVSGTEKSSDARRFAQKEFGLNNLPAEALFEIPGQSFDVVTMWHVLEHIHRLNETMARLHQLLNKAGKLLIAVPNPSSYDARHYRHFWAAYDVPRHIWHFAPEQMRLLGEKHGFRLKSLHRMPFDSFYVSMLSEKYKKSKAGLLKGMFHGTISWINSWFDPAKSSSVIYVFEKTEETGT